MKIAIAFSFAAFGFVVLIGGGVLEASLIFVAIPLAAATITILIGVCRYWRKLQVEAEKADKTFPKDQYG